MLITMSGKLVNCVKTVKIGGLLVLLSTQHRCCSQTLAQLKQVLLDCYGCVLGVSCLPPTSSFCFTVAVFAEC